MRAITALFATALLSACLLGCATAGRQYDDSKIAMIKRGSTTEAQLINWFGPPESRSMAPDGGKTLEWRFGSPGQRRGGRLDVQLGSDGMVTSYRAAGG